MNKGWLFVSAVVAAGVGTSLAACGSSNSGTGNSATTGSTTSTGGSTSSTGTTSSSTTVATGGSTTTSSTSGTGNCGTVSKLHPPEADAGANIYCPFSGVDGGDAQYCTGGTQHCCETPSGSSTPAACEPTGTTCSTGSTDWACQDPVSDCSSATPVCCAPGATLVLGTPAGQCGNYASEMKSTSCVANAAACSGIIMCTSDGECPSGMTCTPFEKAGAQVGGCM